MRQCRAVQLGDMVMANSTGLAHGSIIKWQDYQINLPM